MDVQIKRFHPERDTAPYVATYHVPLPVDGTHTVMDALDYIHSQLDGTLSYYRHSVCNQGICGRCGVRVNGRVSLACTCRIVDHTLSLEPRSSDVVKDLVVW